MNKSKNSLEPPSPLYQTYTSTVIDTHKPKNGPRYIRQVVHPQPKYHKKNQLLPGKFLLIIISVICKSGFKEAHAWLSIPFKETYDESRLIAHFSSSISWESDPAHGGKVTSIVAYVNNVNNWCAPGPKECIFNFYFTNITESLPKIQRFWWRNFIWKCRLQNGDHFVPALMRESIDRTNKLARTKCVPHLK